ncbi:unnamed protein product, partial [Rotaria sordida]
MKVYSHVKPTRNISPPPPLPQHQQSKPYRPPEPLPSICDASPKSSTRNASPNSSTHNPLSKSSTRNPSPEPSSSVPPLRIANILIEPNLTLIDMVPSSFNPHEELDDDD